MENKHTSDEWNYFDNKDLEQITIAGKNKTVCFLNYMKNRGADNFKQVEANAKLITSAPELLEALKIASLYVSSISNKEDWEIISAAIQKATI